MTRRTMALQQISSWLNTAEQSRIPTPQQFDFNLCTRAQPENCCKRKTQLHYQLGFLPLHVSLLNSLQKQRIITFI
ncbi:MAG: hypothetical protein IGS39_24775 [Calothrix sp. C42_A2020_038]|nr:hypothetical protein [Calothrix sp. C42_A2020_038]